MKERVLVIGAHCDDESFGCLGTLLKHKEAKDSISFIWLTPGRDQTEGAKKCAKYFNATYEQLWFADQALDTHTMVALITTIEIRVQLFKPTIVYMPFIADLNMDHRLTSEAGMVACRPYKNNAPKEVWMYQIAGTTELGFRPFVVDKTVAIDAKEKKKLITEWYPEEMINGRDAIKDTEVFERWPRI